MTNATTIKTEVAAMTREALEAEHVAALVLKWGEGEREGSVRQVRGMGTPALQIAAADRRGGDGSKIFGGRGTRRPRHDF